MTQLVIVNGGLVPYNQLLMTKKPTGQIGQIVSSGTATVV